MTHTSSSDSESPKSISSSEYKTRPSTSRSNKGSSGSPSTTVNPPRSVNPAPGALVVGLAGARVRSPPRTRPRIGAPPRTTSTTRTQHPGIRRSEPPSAMSSTQTVTSTITAPAATESGWRVASSESDAYHHRYAATLHFPAARRNALIVNATATLSRSDSSTASRDTYVVNATSSGSGSGSHGAMHDRHAYSYSQSYSQIRTSTTYADEEESRTSSQRHLQQHRTGTSSHRLQSQSSWRNTTIAETPANTDTDAPQQGLAATEPNPRSSFSTYGETPAPVNRTRVSVGAILDKQSDDNDNDHVSRFPDIPGSASASGAGVDPRTGLTVYRPPSLSSYALTPSAAQASTFAASAQTPQPEAWSGSSGTLSANETDRPWSTTQWGTSSSATNTASTSYSVVQPPAAISEASPTLVSSPGSSRDVPFPSWARVNPHAAGESSESNYSRSAKPYAIKVPQRPSLVRSALFPSPSSSPSLQVAPLAASGPSRTSAPAPTSAIASETSPSRVPEPATPFSASQYGSQSPVSPLRSSGGPPLSVRAVLSPVSTAGRQEQVDFSSPSHPEVHSRPSSRLAQVDTSVGYGRAQSHGSPTVFQVPSHQHIGPVRHAPSEPVNETGASPGSSSSVAAADPPSFRGTGCAFGGTSTTTSSGMSVPPPAYSPFAGRSSPNSGLQYTVPVTITAAQLYDYSYTSSSYSAPLVSSVAAAASRSAAGSTSAGQSTRKRNHPCVMCDKRFDRPSTLRKHLLVHTGEKAHVCDICGRRFGVASNLNRHYRRCITRPVNSAAFHSAPASASDPPGTLVTPQTKAMAREQTNPDVRRAERQRDGREVPEGNGTQPPVVPATPSASESTGRPTRGRRRGRSTGQSPLSTHSANTSATPEAGSSSQQMSSQLRPTLGTGGGAGQGSGQVAVATVSTNAGIGDPDSERRPKRRRRAPSPSRWVPASLRNFSLSPIRSRTSTPLPPVSPGYDQATGAYEERDSYATITDENVDPSVGNSEVARRRAERLRNFEYAPYHPCGWTGRLPGPAVVGNDVTNFTKGIGGSRHGGRYHGGNNGGGLHFMFEFSLSAAG